MQRLMIDQSNITRTRIDTVSLQDLTPGQARLRIDRVALTANNVTYAATGFVLGYWKFFPTGIDGQGQVPVWGFAEVTESRSDVLAVGDRLYGFFPLAEALDITPEAQGEKVVVDAAPHRADLPPVYNRYARVSEHPRDDEARQALLQPLLATSFVLTDWLQDNGFFGAEQVVIGSASSKTGLGLCIFLSRLDGRPVRVAGLTSAGNAGFVESLGVCDEVVTYDDLESLRQVPSVYVDMAGNAEVKARLHTHLADHLTHSSAVGTSHWDRFQPKQDLPGPKPQFFFAPAQIEKRRADWGPGVIERKVAVAWKSVAAEASDWMDLRYHSGLGEAQAAYDLLARGKSAPRDGHVIELG